MHSYTQKRVHFASAHQMEDMNNRVKYPNGYRKCSGCRCNHDISRFDGEDVTCSKKKASVREMVARKRANDKARYEQLFPVCKSLDLYAF